MRYRIARLGTATGSYLVFAVLLVAVLYPLFWMLAASLRDRFTIFEDPLGLPAAPSLDNYSRALSQGDFGTNIINSALVTIPSVILLVAISATAGYAFARLRFRGRKVLFMLLLVGVMVPPQAIIITVFQVVFRIGLLDNFLGLILVYMSWSPVAIFILTTFFRGIPAEILEAAEIDGAGIVRTFWFVAMPLAKPALATVCIFYFVWIWNDFIYPLVILQDPTLATIPLGLMQFQGRYRVDWGTQTAALTMAVAVPILFYMFFQDKFVRGLTAGAIKVASIANRIQSERNTKGMTIQESADATEWAADELQEVPRTSVTRREYDEWVHEAVGLAIALSYPVQPSMVTDGTGIVFGDDQYEAFRNGLWSREPYEVMVIFESLNEPGVDGLPAGAEPYAEYGGLCDKLMIVHPGKFCPPHFHHRKTESYEVVLGEMEIFYNAAPVEYELEEGFLARAAMPKGEEWPADVELPAGREESYAALTSYMRLGRSDSKFVMHRQHLHAFRCPPDSKVPLVVREISTYSHEPTNTSARRVSPLPGWAGIHDNNFVSESANTGRLRTRIVP